MAEVGRPGARQKVSRDFGEEPLWTRDGRRPSFRRVSRSTISFGPPRMAVPPRAYRTGSLSHQDYDVASDGTLTFVSPLRPQGLDVIVNVSALLRQSGGK